MDNVLSFLQFNALDVADLGKLGKVIVQSVPVQIKVVSQVKLDGNLVGCHVTFLGPENAHNSRINLFIFLPTCLCHSSSFIFELFKSSAKLQTLKCGHWKVSSTLAVQVVRSSFYL